MIDIYKLTRHADPRKMCRAPTRMSDGRVVATNGASLIVVPQHDGEFEPTAPENEAKIIGLTDLTSLTDWRPTSSLAMPELKPCGLCKGSLLIVETECPDCEGSGEFQHGSHTYTCGECDGDGFNKSRMATADDDNAKPCHECDGLGFAGRHQPVIVPGIQNGYALDARQIAQFPAGGEFAVNDGTLDSVRLRGDGWVGLIMPMIVR